MKTETKCISDDNGVETNVEFEYEVTEGYYEVPNNIASWVEPTAEVNLKIVELIIGGVGVDILPLLTPLQIKYVKNKLNL